MRVESRTARVASVTGLLEHRPHHDLQSPDVAGDDRVGCFVQRYRMRAGDHFGVHLHGHAQLSWIDTGTGWAEVGTTRTTLTAAVASWIPPGVPHDIGATRVACLYNVYLGPGLVPEHLRRPATVTVTPLARELVLHLADGAVDSDQRRRVEVLLWELLVPSAHVLTDVPTPADPIARLVAEQLCADPSTNDTIDVWGKRVGCSGRTLARRFVESTGLTFSDWRAQLRIRTATELLAQGSSPSAVASTVGYQSASAFVAAFRRVTGITPGEYQRTRQPS